MKIKTLLILYGIVALLVIGVIVAQKSQNRDALSSALFERGHKPFTELSELQNEITTIEVEKDDVSTTLELVNGSFTVNQRDGYPADKKKIQSLINTLSNVSIAQSIEAGESFNGRFGIDTTITLKDAQGDTIRKLQLGKDIISDQQQVASLTGQSNAKGTYLRLPEDPQHIYAMNAPISGVSPSPRHWLSEDFLRITKITSITLSKPGSEETDWQLTRDHPRSSFSLSGPIPDGMEPDTSTISNLNNQFGYANFEDVLSAAAAKGLSDHSKTRRATIETSEGFTYIIHISPKTIKGTENKILTFTVAENFRTERLRPAAETVEEGDSADQYFAQQLAEKKKRFLQIKALEGTYYEVSSFVVENLLKSRHELLKQKAE